MLSCVLWGISSSWFCCVCSIDHVWNACAYTFVVLLVSFDRVKCAMRILIMICMICSLAGTMGSFKAVTAKALVDAGAGTPLVTCVPHTDAEVAGELTLYDS